jgi:hypothetical protein
MAGAEFNIFQTHADPIFAPYHPFLSIMAGKTDRLSGVPYMMSG